MKNLIVAILVIVVAALLVTMAYQSCAHKKALKLAEMEGMMRTADTTTVSVLPNGQTVATNEIVKTEIKEVIKEKMIPYFTDTLAPLLEVASNKVVQLTQVNAVLSGKVKAKNAIIDSLGKVKMVYQTKYLTAETNTIDSTLTYQYNAEIYMGAYKKKGSTYVFATSPDTNFRINGVTKYEQKVKKPKSHFAVTWDSRLTIGLQKAKVARVYSGLQLDVGPDSRLNPYLGVGYEYDSERMYPVANGGLKLRLIER